MIKDIKSLVQNKLGNVIEDIDSWEDVMKEVIVFIINMMTTVDLTIDEYKESSLASDDYIEGLKEIQYLYSMILKEIVKLLTDKEEKDEAKIVGAVS